MLTSHFVLGRRELLQAVLRGEGVLQTSKSGTYVLHPIRNTIVLGHDMMTCLILIDLRLLFLAPQAVRGLCLRRNNCTTTKEQTGVGVMCAVGLLG